MKYKHCYLSLLNLQSNATNKVIHHVPNVAIQMLNSRIGSSITVQSPLILQYLCLVASFSPLLIFISSRLSYTPAVQKKGYHRIIVLVPYIQHCHQKYGYHERSMNLLSVHIIHIYHFFLVKRLLSSASTFGTLNCTYSRSSSCWPSFCISRRSSSLRSSSRSPRLRPANC